MFATLSAALHDFHGISQFTIYLLIYHPSLHTRLNPPEVETKPSCSALHIQCTAHGRPNKSLLNKWSNELINDSHRTNLAWRFRSLASSRHQPPILPHLPLLLNGKLSAPVNSVFLSSSPFWLCHFSPSGLSSHSFCLPRHSCFSTPSSNLPFSRKPSVITPLILLFLTSLLSPKLVYFTASGDSRLSLQLG